MKINLKRLVFLGLALRLLLIFTPPHVDIFNHVDWGKKLWEYGPKDFYEQIFWGVSWPNQPVGSMLLFGLIAKIYTWIFQFLWQINLKIAAFPSFIFPFLEKNFHLVLLKLPFALADLGIGVLIYKIVKNQTKKGKSALLGASFFLFNPALIYNSTVWGQTDSLVNLLGLLGIWEIWKKKYFWGILAFLGSLYFKLSLIIFAPLLGLMLLYQFLNLAGISCFRRPTVRGAPSGHLGGGTFFRGVFRLLVSLAGVISIFLLISLPFVHHGNVVSWLWYLYTNRVLPRQGDMLSGNAFNFWTLIFGQDFSLRENIPFLSLTAQFWGKVLFLLFSGLATLLLFFKKKKGEFLDYLWLGMVYAFSAFLFLTNMHERYLYPVFPLMAIVAVKDKRLLRAFIVLSGIHLINLYNLWWYPHCEFLGAVLTGFNDFLPRLLSLVNIGIFTVLVKWFSKGEKKLV